MSLAAALLSFAVAYAVLATAFLPGPVNLVIGGALLALLPTAPILSQRIALNGALALGWAPAIWYFRWPFSVDHAAVLVAGSAGVMAFLVVRSRFRRAGQLRFIPRLRPTDAFIGGSVIAASLSMHGWIFVRSPHEALATLLPGFDNSAHYQIFSTMRAQGVNLANAAPAPDGGSWRLDGYPAAFHALTATISELLHPQVASGPNLLVAYTQSVAVVIVLCTAVLTAAVVSLPRLGDRGWIAAPCVVTPWAAMLWEPGQKVIADGFAPFWVAAVAVACALVMSVDVRCSYGLRLVAVVGLLVTVLNVWPPLLLLVAPVGLLYLHDVLRFASDRFGRVAWLVGIVGLCLGLLVVFLGLQRLINSVGMGILVRATGGISNTSPLPTMVLLTMALYVCLAFPALTRAAGGGGRDERVSSRVRVLVWTPLIAVASLTIFLVAQLQVVGKPSYYFFKYLIGVEIVLAGLVPALVGLLIATTAASHPPRRRERLGGLAVTLCVSQAFAPFPWGAVGLAAHPGGTAVVDAPYSAVAIAEGIIHASSVSDSTSGFRSEYVALGRERAITAFYTDAWYHALTISFTSVTAERVDVLRNRRLEGAADAAPYVRRLLRTSPDVRVVVPPEFLPGLQARMPSLDFADRIVTWETLTP